MVDTIELHTELRRLLGRDPTVKKIATGFSFTEGPVWDCRMSRLIFSDIPGNTVFQWTEARGHTVLRKPSDHTNGNTLDAEGRLLSCEHSRRRVSRTDHDGRIETVSSHFKGKRFNSPNDVVCSSRGEIYFTDPPYGLRQPDGSFADQEIEFCGVYRFSEHGGVTLLGKDFTRPNGIVLNNDETQLFVDDTDRHHVRFFDLAGDGTLQNDRIFAKLEYNDIRGKADGMKMDEKGNIYVAGNTLEGIWVFDPEGTLLGLIGVGEGPANLAWGGTDWKTLFITAKTSVYRLPMGVAGQPVGIQ